MLAEEPHLIHNNKYFMKVICLTVLWAALAQISIMAETVITSPQGVVYHVSDWSPSTSVNLQAAQGTIPAVMRKCTVYQENSRRPINPIQFIYSATLGQVLIGEPVDNYAVVDKKIWGQFTRNTNLHVQQSEECVDAAGLEAALQKYTTKYLSFPQPSLWNDGTIKVMDMRQVFGLKAVIGKGPARAPRGYLNIINITASPNGITTTFDAPESESTLSVTISPAMKILEVFEDGVSYPVFFDSFPTEPKMAEWPFGDNKTISSTQGELPAMRFVRHYGDIEGIGPNHLFPTLFAYVLVSTGDMWIGPESCSCFLMNGQIVGFSVNSTTHNIEIYKSKQTRIPLDSGSAQSFQDQLLKYDSRFIASNYNVEPDLKINIPKLFSNDSRITQSKTLDFRSMSLRNGNVVVKINADPVAQKYPEITIGPDLNVVSTRLQDDPNVD